MKDYYAVLGISSIATGVQIKVAYRKKAASFHPDRNPKAEASLLFQEVQEAYDVLGNDELRERYDSNRRRGLLDDPQQEAHAIWEQFLESNMP